MIWGISVDETPNKRWCGGQPRGGERRSGGIKLDEVVRSEIHHPGLIFENRNDNNYN